MGTLIIRLNPPRHIFYWRVCIKQRKWVVIYLCTGDIYSRTTDYLLYFPPSTKLTSTIWLKYCWKWR